MNSVYIPIYAFDDSGDKRYLFTVDSNMGLLGIDEVLKQSTEEYPYKKFYCIFQGVELLAYEKRASAEAHSFTKTDTASVRDILDAIDCQTANDDTL